ncbi:mannose-1-phosphate guanylyltransferase/mannose-6-phosphate isomerase [Desulfospira joergensenii]|uniref:mannose-1-phosphate guanylyltransferase/mannose-6-phosphate isomerase n=1 Tax=Desulfospira joergensenii TaxID=53329 RepID=UPI0003B621C4|nr:mannose-1-phosphate guanylyltransferase/mannose-6-phosphate isomerase [Desulfospira joergensenii]
MIVPVILAGGSGTRLWPLSRELYPKQLIDLYNKDTMIQNTLLRLDGVENLDRPLVVCNEEHRFMTAEQLRQIHKDPLAIILEPVGRNTAPAICLAVLKLLEKGEDPILLVLPADHVIENRPAFHEAITKGAGLAEQGYLITFGIVPLSPETGYGYIQKGENMEGKGTASRIAGFVEKPDLETARAYLDSKEYYWNSGMFMFQASTIVAELEIHAPQMVDLCRKAMAGGRHDLDFFRIDRESFFSVEPDSIDYAVMEKTDRGAVIPLDAGWNDLGSFDALWQTGKKNGDSNVIDGDVLIHDVADSYIHAGSRLVAAVGLEKFVIVETRDAVLVSPRDRVQDVKKIVNQLKAQKREEAISHSRVYRPWGDYESIDASDRFQVKRITVKPGAKLSLQKHFHRAEHWTVVSGAAIVTRGEEEILLKEDESAYIPLGTVHRLENPGKIPLELIEVQSGSYLGEDDIVRFDDVYGREED